MVRSPAAGIFLTDRTVGGRVEAGDSLGSVEGVEVQSRIGGLLRGLIHSGLTVYSGEKLGDVDPRPHVDLDSISDKARGVSGGVLEAIMRWHCGALRS